MKLSRCCTNLIIMVLFGFASWAHHGVASHVVEEAKSQQPVVMNKTRALQVVSFKPIESAEPGGQAYELVLRNTSVKKIDAYSIAYGESSTRGGDFIGADRLIGPGDQFTQIINPPTRLIITYVVFADGSIDGDVAAAQPLLEQRRGMLAQFERILPLLKTASASGDVEHLRSEVQALPRNAETSDSVYVSAGLRHARDEVLREIELLDWNDPVAGLRKLEQQVQQRVSRLEKHVKR